jgi:peptidoglycan L-alanyl-D-glutamate endopeptidase CwlK
MYSLGQTSLERLSTCEDDLIKVAKLAIQLSPHDFGISQGIRTPEEQKELYKRGLSKTLLSRHLANAAGKSEALDFTVYVGGKPTWEVGYYRDVAQAFFTAAITLGVQIEAGVLWKDFVDGPHIQLA